MCRPASMIVNKEFTPLWSKDSESHTDIIEEHKLKEQNVRGEYNFVPIEIVPPDNDYKAPLSKWEFYIDFAGYERDLPKWWDKKKAEKQVRKELKKWRKAKIVMPNEKIELVNAGQKIAIYGQVNCVSGNGQVNCVSGNGQVNCVLDNGQVNEVSGNGQVNCVSGNGQVNCVSDNGQVKKVSGNGQVNYVSGNGQVKKVSGNGQVNYVSGNGQVNCVSDNGQVNYVFGNGQVNEVYGNGTIITSNSLSPDILKSSQAVLIDRTKDPVVCYVGKK